MTQHGASVREFLGHEPSVREFFGLGAGALAHARFVLRRKLSRDPSRELSADRRFVLAAVRHHRTSSTPSSYLKHASTELRADREVVMAAVKRRGSALQYASAGLQADREVVMAAFRTRPGRLYRDKGDYFQYASPTLKADIDFVRAAVILCGAYAALQHVSAELQVDPALDFLRSQWQLRPSNRQWRGDVTCLVPRDLMYLDTRQQKLQAYTLAVIVAKVSLTRDRDALGAAVGVRTIPAPHVALNGAPAALAMVHYLISSQVAAICVWLETRGSLGVLEPPKQMSAAASTRFTPITGVQMWATKQQVVIYTTMGAPHLITLRRLVFNYSI